MSAVAPAPAVPTVYRRAVVFCVLPTGLAWLQDDLRHLFSEDRDIRVVVERRSSAESDRRSGGGSAPSGEERRSGARRVSGASTVKVTELGVHLPWGVRRHADRISCVERMLPVHLADAQNEADDLLADAAAGDSEAQMDLRLRYHTEVHGHLRAGAAISRRRVDKLTDVVFEELFSVTPSAPFATELARAYTRALSR